MDEIYREVSRRLQTRLGKCEAVGDLALIRSDPDGRLANFAHLAGVVLGSVTAIRATSLSPVDGVARSNRKDVLLAMAFKPYRRDIVGSHFICDFARCQGHWYFRPGRDAGRRSKLNDNSAVYNVTYDDGLILKS